jgi:hypothetical protein
MLTLLLIIPSAASELEVSKYSDDSSNLGITSISAKKDVVGLWSTGYTWLNLGINVTNYGNETETFNATFYANSTIIQEISNITVEVQNFTIVVFRGAVAGSGSQ